MSDVDQAVGGSETTSSRSKRRAILKTLGTGMLAGLAGCSGDGGDGGSGDGTTASDGGDGGDGGGGTTTQGDGSPDLSGTSFTFHDMVLFQAGKPVQKAIERITKNFEQATGATVNLNFTDEESKVAAEFQSGNPPHGIIVDPGGASAWAGADWLRPADEWLGNFPIIADQMKPFAEGTAQAWQGYDGQYSVTIGAQMPTIVGRLDFYEQTPGLSRDDFPPKDYQELIEHGQALQSDGPATYGYQPTGTGGGDWADVAFIQWMCANDTVSGGSGGLYFGDDWSDINVDNKTWIEWHKKKRALFVEHGLGAPNTPSMSAEKALRLMIGGQVGLCHEPMTARVNITPRAPQLVKNNDIAFGKAWSGSNNILNAPRLSGILLPKPVDTDEKKFQRQQKAAIEYFKFMFDPNRGNIWKQMWTNMGYVPTPKVPFNNMPENSTTTQAKWYSTAKSLVEDTSTFTTLNEGNPGQVWATEYLPTQLTKANYMSDSPSRSIEDIMADVDSAAKEQNPFA